jgi:hypothetical protein
MRGAAAAVIEACICRPIFLATQDASPFSRLARVSGHCSPSSVRIEDTYVKRHFPQRTMEELPPCAGNRNLSIMRAYFVRACEVLSARYLSESLSLSEKEYKGFLIFMQ